MGEPFWDFSIAVYGAPAVADECLALQDQFGLDVNLLLLCAFLGAVHGVALTAEDIAAARRETGPWHNDIVRPLRAARRALKPIGADQPADAANNLREQVKAAELEAEHIEQTMLERWAMARIADRPPGNARDAVLASLQALFAAYGIGPERRADTMQHLLAAALARAPDSQKPPR